MGTAGLALGAAIGLPLVGAVKSAADFEFAMDGVNAALGGVDTSVMERLNQQALDIGAASKFSATEVSGLQQALGKSGIDAEQLLAGATQSAVDLAAATGESLVPAGEAAAAALNLFNLEAEDSARVADIYTGALNNSSASLADMQRGINSLGPVLANQNRFLDDGEGAFLETSAAIAFFNANGLKAADAGISIARGLTNLADPSSDATKQLEALGISAFDAQGNFLPLPDLFDQLNSSMSGLSDQAREQALAQIFGAEAADVMNQAIKQGGAGMREMEDALRQEGIAAEQAAIRQDNLSSALEQLGGSVNAAAIALGAPLIDPIRAVAEGLKGLVDAFTGLPAGVQEFIALFGAASAALLTFGGGAALVVGKVLQLGQTFAAAGLSLGKFAAALGLIGLAIGAGILAYQTNFLGFADLINGALAKAATAAKKFGDTFQAAFSKRTAAGVNPVSAALESFAAALFAATGIDLVTQFSTLSNAAEAFGNTLRFALDNGMNPVTAGLMGMAAAADELGLTGVSDALDVMAEKAQTFGNVFEASFAGGQTQGLNDAASAVQAVGDALSTVTGIDVTDPFERAASAIQAFGDQFQQATEAGIDPFTASLLGLRDAAQTLTSVDLTSTFDGIGTFLDTIRQGDFRGAFDQLGTALRGLGDVIGPALQNLGPALQEQLANLGDTLGEIDFSDIAQTVGDALGSALQSVGDFIGTVDWGAVADTIVGLVSGAAGLLGQIDTALAEALAFDPADYPKVEQAGSKIGADLGAFIGEAIASVFSGGGEEVAGGISTQAAKSPLTGAPTGNVVEAAIRFADAFAQQFVAEIARAMGAESLARALEAEDPWGAIEEGIQQWFQDQADAFALPDIDFSAIPNAIGAELQKLSEGIFQAFNEFASSFTPDSMGGPGERGEAGTASAGLTAIFTDFATGFLEQVGNGIAQAVEAIKSGLEAKKTDLWNGIKDALFGIFAFVTGMEDVQAAEGTSAEALDATKLGTEMGTSFGQVFQSPEFTDAFEASFAEVPASAFQGVAATLLGKIQESLAGALTTGAVPSETTGMLPTEGGGMGQSLVTSLANGLTTSVQEADVGLFAPVGQALLAKINASLAGVFATGAVPSETQGMLPTEGGGMGASIVQSLATSLAASIAAAPIEGFAAVGAALQAKIAAALNTAFAGGGPTGPAGLGGAPSGGGGIGAAIVQSLTAAIQGADFSPLATALTSAIAAPMNAFATTLDVAFAAIGQAITGYAAQWGTALASGVTSAIQQGVAAAAAASQIGTTILTSAITALGGGTVPPGGVGPPGPAPEGSGGGLDGAVTGMVTAAVNAGVSAASAASQIGTAIVSAAVAGVGGGGGAPTGPTGLGGVPSGGGGGSLDGAVTGMVSSAIAAGVQAAGAASQIGAAISAGAASGIDVNALVGPAVAMVNNAIAAAQEAAGAASPSTVARDEIGQPIAEGAAIGIADGTPLAVDAAAALGEQAASALGDAAAQVSERTREIVGQAILAIKSIAGDATPAAFVDVARRLEELFFGGENVTPDTLKTEEAAATAAAAGEAVGSSFGESMVSAMLGQMTLGGDGIGGQAIQELLGSLSNLVTVATDAGEEIANGLTSGITSGIDQGLGGTLTPEALGIPEAGRSLAQGIIDSVQGRLAQQATARNTWLPQVEGMLADRNARIRELQGEGRPIVIQITTELDGEALDERIVETTMGGAVQASGRNPLTRRRR